MPRGGKRQGAALISFWWGRGRATPLDPLPPVPWTPPLPPRSKARKTHGSGNLFVFRQFVFSCTFSAPMAGFFGHSTHVTSSLCCKYHVAVSHTYVLWHPNPTVPLCKTHRRCNRNPLFSLSRSMEWEEMARGIQCCTESMFHPFSEHSNGSSVRVCEASSHNGATEHGVRCLMQPFAVNHHPAQILLVPLPVQKRMTIGESSSCGSNSD